MLAIRFALTNGADLVLHAHIDERTVNGLGCCFFTNALDVVRGVGDIGDVDVNKVETDFVEFGLYVLANRIKEAFSVLVDLLDGERRHCETQLTEDDLPRHIFDSVRAKTKQTLCRIVHDAA